MLVAHSDSVALVANAYEGMVINAKNRTPHERVGLEQGGAELLKLYSELIFLDFSKSCFDFWFHSPIVARKCGIMRIDEIR